MWLEFISLFNHNVKEYIGGRIAIPDNLALTELPGENGLGFLYFRRDMWNNMALRKAYIPSEIK